MTVPEANSAVSQSDVVRLTQLEVRVAELEQLSDELRAERDALREELEMIANRATDRWLSAAQFESKALAAMQATVSWRVTKPLRAVRSAQAVIRRRG